MSISVKVPNNSLSRLTANSRSNNFNFLRLLFAALVLIAHAPELRDGNRSHELLTCLFGSISFGELAVNGFFLLSGYLIVASWTRQPELKNFLERRVRRIVPGFLVAFLVSVFVLGPFGTHHPVNYFASLNYLLQAKLALELRQPEVAGVFVGQPYPLLNGAMWSIGYEFRCYLIVAIVGLLGANRQKALWLLLFVAAMGLSLMPKFVSQINFPGIWHVIGDPIVFVRVFAFFGAGACFCLFQPAITLRRSVAALAAGAVVGALFSPLLVTPVLATAGAYLLFWFVFAQIPALVGFQRINDVSYGLYLYGWPIQKLLQWYLPTTTLWVLVPVALAACSALGYVSWHLVELPWLQRKRSEPVLANA